MKKIKLYESVLDPFNEEDWDEEDEPFDYISIYISNFSIIVSENKINGEKGNYTYLNTPSESDIPYNNNKLKKNGKRLKKVYIDDGDESSEWLILTNDRDEVVRYKSFIESCINDNIEKYFGIEYKFRLNGGFQLYPLDIEIQVENVKNFVNKYLFKN